MATPEDDWQFPEAIKTLAGAQALNASKAAKVWLASVAFGVLAFVSYQAQFPIMLDNIAVPLPWAPILVFFVTVLANVHFCSSYIKQGQTTSRFHAMVEERMEREPLARRSDRKAACYSLLPTFLATISPLAMRYPQPLEPIVYAVLKAPIDFILFALPAAAYILAFLALPAGLEMLDDTWRVVFTVITWGMLVVAGLATVTAYTDASIWGWRSMRRLVRRNLPKRA